MEKLKKYIFPTIAIILFFLICIELILLGQHIYYNYIEEKHGIANLDTEIKSKPVEGCFGKVELEDGNCKSGDTLLFKIKHAWGASKTVLIDCN